MPVSTEITGYSVSFFVYLHSLSGDERYLDAAVRAARFLTRTAWDRANQVMPFEGEWGGLGARQDAGRATSPSPSHSYTYFFDCGIIVRGLLSAWRATKDEQFLAVAVAVGNSMMRDFASDEGDFHPVLALPGKTPVERDAARWSRSAGCYQLKAAMAWWDLFEATGENCFREPYKKVLEYSVAGYVEFCARATMDGLHACCYFLEGLLPYAHEPRYADALQMGINLVGASLRRFAPQFARSDVYAQLMRARLFAHWAGSPVFDHAAAAEEAHELARFQADDGGYWFGRKSGELMPYINPVSAAFAGQALELWENRQQVTRHALI
jgi:hypothetical protein